MLVYSSIFYCDFKQRTEIHCLRESTANRSHISKISPHISVIANTLRISPEILRRISVGGGVQSLAYRSLGVLVN